MTIEQNKNQISRRDFLKIASKAAAGLAFMTGSLHAVTGYPEPAHQADELELYDFIMPRVKSVAQRQRGMGQGPDIWNIRPGGDSNLLRRLSTVIRCKTKPIVGTNDWEPNYAREGQLNAVVTFDDLESIKRYPFLFMTEENSFQFNQTQKNNLEEYIMRGGFLLMDDCVVGAGGDFFYQSAYRLLEEVFGKGAVRRMPNEHEIFHNVYDLGDTGLPSMYYAYGWRPGYLPYMPGRTLGAHGQNHGARGVFIGDRLAVFLSSTDLHCGWCDSGGTTWTRASYEKAIQMGINIIMYAISH